jgi:hypothetical protein
VEEGGENVNAQKVVENIWSLKSFIEKYILFK